MEKLRSIVRSIDWLCEVVAKCAMCLILIYVAVTTYDVFLRYFFDAPTIWARELTSLLFGPLWLLTGAYLLSTDEHVRMDLFYHPLSNRKKAIIDLITFTLFFFYFAILVYYAWGVWWSTFITAEVSRSVWKPILWPFHLGIPLGITLLLLAGIAKYIRDMYVAITGRDWHAN